MTSALELHNKDHNDEEARKSPGNVGNLASADNVSTTSEPPTDSPARSPHARHAWTVPGFQSKIPETFTNLFVWIFKVHDNSQFSYPTPR